MNAIIDDLIADHQRFRKFLTHYERELDALRTGGEPDYGLLNDLAEYFSQFPDELHHKKEDIIYEFLIASDDERASSPSQGNERLFDLKSEHDTISRDASTFREGVKQVLAGEQLPRDQLSHFGTDYVLSLRRHMQGEETSFFPRALASISDEDWGVISARISDLSADKVDYEKTREILEIEKDILRQIS